MIAPGAEVIYAQAPYEVVRVNADLLVLAGVAYQIARRVWRCRESCAVLAEDVVVVVGRGEGE